MKKYLWTLALVALIVSLASSVSFAAVKPFIALQYNATALTSSAASVAKVPVPITGATALFADVPTDNWAWGTITEAARAATAAYPPYVVAGFSETSFGPTLPVGRGAMAVFISRAAGYTEDAPLVATFPDVRIDYWAFAEVERAVEHSVVFGYPANPPTVPDILYRPEVLITRDQMAVFIQRAAVLPTDTYDGRFIDIVDEDSPGWWAAEQIQACVDEDIVQGYAGNLYKPSLQVTRDQIATFVWRGLIRDDGCVVLGGFGATDDAAFVPGDDTADYWLPDVVTATGVNSVSVGPGAVVYVVLDAVQVPDGDVTFTVLNSDDDEVGGDSVTIDADAAELAVVGPPIELPYLVVAYQIPDLTDADDYTVTVELPNGAVLGPLEFTVD